MDCRAGRRRFERERIALKPEAVVHDVGDLRFSMRRHWIDAYLKRRAGEWPEGLMTVDVGGNRLQRRGAFDIGRFSRRVMTVNISAAKSPLMRADAAELPFVDGCFDAAVCTETLEHVYDPRRVVAEIARVTRSDSRLLVTVPFMVGIHADPDDYGRYTPSFWTRLLNDCGFDQVEIEEHGRLGSVLLDIMRNWLLARRAAAEGPQPLLRFLEVGLRAARRHVAHTEAPRSTGRSTDAAYTTGYGISARRRECLSLLIIR